jgi:hypothetical protein
VRTVPPLKTLRGLLGFWQTRCGLARLSWTVTAVVSAVVLLLCGCSQPDFLLELLAGAGLSGAGHGSAEATGALVATVTLWWLLRLWS